MAEKAEIKSNINIVTVIHKSSFPATFFSSIANQEIKDFALWIFFHNAPEKKILVAKKWIKILEKEKKIKVIKHVANNFYSIPKVREVVLRMLCGALDSDSYIIFVDSDDVYLSSHIKEMLKILDHSKAVVSRSVLYFEEEDRDVGNIKCEKKSIKFPKDIPRKIKLGDILEKNILGFGNTGIVKEIIPEKIKIPNYLIATDWWFYTKILYFNNICVRTIKKPTQLYRIHRETSAGFFEITEEYLSYGLRVKTRHYRALRDLGEPFSTLFNRYIQTEKCFSTNKNFRERYIQKIKEMYENKQWWLWEPIKRADDLGLVC